MALFKHLCYNFYTCTNPSTSACPQFHSNLTLMCDGMIQKKGNMRSEINYCNYDNFKESVFNLDLADMLT